MKKIILFAFISILSLSFVTGCNDKKTNDKDDKDKKDKKYETVTNIELGKEQYIKQLEKIKINNTDDYIIITKNINLSLPEDDNIPEGSMVSMAWAIPYTIYADGKEYTGEYLIVDVKQGGNDKNPKYNFTIKSIEENYDTLIVIDQK